MKLKIRTYRTALHQKIVQYSMGRWTLKNFTISSPFVSFQAHYFCMIVRIGLFYSTVSLSKLMCLESQHHPWGETNDVVYASTHWTLTFSSEWPHVLVRDFLQTPHLRAELNFFLCSGTFRIPISGIDNYTCTLLFNKIYPPTHLSPPATMLPLRNATENSPNH